MAFKLPKSGIKLSKSAMPKEGSPAEEKAEPLAEAAAEGDVQAFQPHEIEDAAATITKAEEHKQNPALMKAVNKHLAKKKHAISSAMNGLEGLKNKAQSRLKELNEPENIA